MSAQEARSDIPSPGAPSDGGPAEDVLARAGIMPVDYSERHPLSHEEWQARGMAAYDLGEELEGKEGLSPDAITAYREASVSLNNATWEAPEDKLENPLRTWMIASSLAKQAQAEVVEPYSEPQYDEEGRLIDRRENLKRISSELLVHAGAMTSSQDGEVSLVWDDGAAPLRPSDLVRSAAKKAGEATGEDTAPYLEAVAEEVNEPDTAEDNVVVLRPELVAKTAEIALSELRAAHEVPAATAVAA